MKKLKVAVITNRPNWILNGTVKYNRTLYQGVLSEHEVTEYPMFKFVDDKNIMADPLDEITVSKLLCEKNGLNYIGKTTFSKWKLNQILNNHDIVIVSDVNFPKKIIKNEKVILVQHMDKRFYSLSGKSSINKMRVFGYIFGSILFNIGTLRNGLKLAKNVVFFNKETSVQNKNNKYYAQLSTKYREDISIDNRKDTDDQITWIARFKIQKQPMNAIVLANKNPSMRIYGSGPLEQKMLKTLINEEQMVGPVMNKDVVSIMQKTKIHVVTSKIEGACYTMVEALSEGVPVVCWDTFDAVKFFEKSNAVFSFKKGDYDSMQDKINSLITMPQNEYKEIQEKAINFSTKHMSLDTFDEVWKKILSDLA